ncbi:selenide, water dikinase SelD [Sediminimonas sp.]|uniref:selenide, water dikinase SelD n=1 Tax=Sediminimonas sp. TaxID=2823379 RepID=UPI0025F03CD3|nr:selenide, water dikinase SelD [Sediminimonas sp.]
MQPQTPLTRDLVLIGGGHTHALVLRRWGMAPLPGARLTLINPGPTAPYSGMLPGHIAGHYTRQELEIDLVRLARFAGARLITAHANGIDPQAGRITTDDGREIGYDLASIDIGITARMSQLPGFADHAIPAKPLDTYAVAWRDFLDRLDAGKVSAQVAVIGAGVAGVELSMAMAHAMRTRGADPRVTLIERGPGLSGVPPRAEARLRRALDANGVTLMTGAQVRRVTESSVELAEGAPVPAAFTVGAAGAFAHDWLAQTPLPLEDGFIRVDRCLRVEGHDTLFAVGDCAHMTHTPRPKAGVFAVRAAPVLYQNLRGTLTGRRLRPFRPQGDYLKLISLGGKSAMAEKWGRPVAGPLLWHWKDRIDRGFMEKFRQLPRMTAPAQPAPLAVPGAEDDADAGKPLCAGCGAKVGAERLAGVLSALPAPGRADVLSRPGDDAAVLDMGGGRRQVITTDHLRAFTEDPWLMARIAAVHALGDIWAMGAAPQAALASVTLPRMSGPLQSRTMAEIMTAAADVFTAEGAEIVGGHSTMGAEMVLGFTVTGLCDGAPITIAGARPGDALILTRPIGSGTLLAADMAGAADGRHIAALLVQMAQPQGTAARQLTGAHAMTDVTGFGLAGHLWAIARASGVGAEIDLDAVPFYDGALEMAAAGHRSTLYPDNAAAAPVAGATGPRAALLHDPQTAGGLLAAVAAEDAPGVLAALHTGGVPAVRIGTVTEGPPHLRCAG